MIFKKQDLPIRGIILILRENNFFKIDDRIFITNSIFDLTPKEKFARCKLLNSIRVKFLCKIRFNDVCGMPNSKDLNGKIPISSTLWVTVALFSVILQRCAGV